ncbi:MAG: GH92 family glycosyl hydrolase, partial [Bacteroidales bacterium]
FDPAYGFMRAKNAKGEWIEPFDPVEWGGPFTEGSSWHYTWSVFHDPLGLAKLMGGPEKMADKLDSMFVVAPDYKVGTYGFVIHEIAEMVALNMGQYAHGNQPVQHAIYLYNYTDRPWKAQYHLRDVMTKLYNSSPKGYCGDEDNGQTSAWYVFSAMGFYPVCPGQPEYVIGSPLFQKVTMKLPNGKEFVVKADKNSPENVYIQKAKLNNKNFENNFITHDQILNGGILEFVMGKNPNTKRGLKKENRPYSFTQE